MVNNYISEQSKLQSLPQDLFERLRDDILKGKIKNGEKMTEQNICKEYKVSRTPVREAFQKLELDGLIEIIPNRGAFVRSLSKQDIEDMYMLREAYETIAVRWAIERMTDEQFKQLQEIYEFMEFYTMKQDPEKMLMMNTNFHKLIYDMADNRMLKHILSSYQVYTKNTKLSSEYIKEYLDQVFSEHSEIFDAFTQRDADAAAQAAIKHMENSKKRAGFGQD